MFAYCGNNPITHVDYTGYIYLENKSDLVGVYGGGGSIISLLFPFTWLPSLFGFETYEYRESLALDEEDAELATATITPQTSQQPVYYGIDLYGGQFHMTTDPMTFDEAIVWATATAASGRYSTREAWGLYTTNQIDAMTIAMCLGVSGPVSLDEASRNHLAHFHTSNRVIVDNNRICHCAKSFHVWYLI